jgi:pimeloyl-ACP methyl ester carboxylesterase
MKQVLRNFFGLICLSIITLSAGASPARAAARIEVLDRQEKPVTKLVDGNHIRLLITLEEAVAQASQVSFDLETIDFPVANCTIQAGDKSCQSEIFPALGWYWGPDGVASAQRTVMAVVDSSAVEASAVIEVAPRPVVLVHGFNSDYTAWANYLGPQGYLASIGLPAYAVGDGQAAGVMNTGSFTEPTRRTNTLLQNAGILQGYIAGVKQQTGAEMVDLLVHSMGGMISRVYIDRLMGEGEMRDVAQLIMLGTPHLGSDCANLPVALGWYMPAALEIRSSYARQILNSQFTHRKGVAFFELAGDPILKPVGSPCTDVPSDIVVSLESAAGIPVELSKLSFLHIELNTSPDVFEQFVKPLLQKKPGEFADAPDPQLPAADTSNLLQFTRVYTGRIDPGGSQDLTIHIEAGVGVASFAMYEPSHSIETTVIGASGNAIELDLVKNGLREIEDPATLVNLGYGFENPKPGDWHILLKATARTPASGAEYALMAKFIGGATFEARIDKVLPQVGEAVQITTRLSLNGEPLAIQTAEARVLDPDGKSQNVVLVDSGDGFTASWKPGATGLYAIDVSVSAVSPDGIPVERAAFLAVEAQPETQVIPPGGLLAAVGLGVALLFGFGFMLVVGVVVLWFVVFRRRRV